MGGSAAQLQRRRALARRHFSRSSCVTQRAAWRLVPSGRGRKITLAASAAPSSWTRGLGMCWCLCIYCFKVMLREREVRDVIIPDGASFSTELTVLLATWPDTSPAVSFTAVVSLLCMHTLIPASCIVALVGCGRSCPPPPRVVWHSVLPTQSKYVVTVAMHGSSFKGLSWLHPPFRDWRPSHIRMLGGWVASGLPATPPQHDSYEI